MSISANPFHSILPRAPIAFAHIAIAVAAATTIQTTFTNFSRHIRTPFRHLQLPILVYCFCGTVASIYIFL